MRTFILILLAITLSTNHSSAQQMEMEDTRKSQELYDFHIQKKKANNLAGWLTLGGGTAMVLTGLIINSGEDSANLLTEVATFGLAETTDKNKGSWLIYLGGGATLASIPLFIAAGKHKRKAEIQLKNGTIGLNQRVNYSGLSITFNF